MVSIQMAITKSSFWKRNTTFSEVLVCILTPLMVFLKISVLTDIDKNFKDILVFINYSKFKYIFNLYIKISLKVYEMIISITFEKKH